MNEDYEDQWLGPLGPDLNPLDFFLWGCMKSRVYHGGKPEAWDQLTEATDEATTSITNELGSMQWHND
jgi:hypothetical protein